MRGEKIRIDKDSLPGAILFPAFVVPDAESSEVPTAIGATSAEPVGTVVEKAVPVKANHR